MDTVIIGAVRSRAAQSLMVLLLAALLTAAAVAAPWFGLAVAARVASSDVAAAPPAQRVLSLSKPVQLAGDPQATLDEFRGALPGLLPIDGAATTLGMIREMVYRPVGAASASSEVSVAYREGFCAHARLSGTCPAAADEAAVSNDTALRLKLKVGDEFAVRQSPSGTPAPFRVTALYDLADPAGAYWANPLFHAAGSLDPMFTTIDGFKAPELRGPTLIADLDVPAPLLRGDNRYNLRTVVGDARDGLAAEGVHLENPTRDLLRQIATDRTDVLLAVLIALCQVLVLGVFALGLAGRSTLRDRRNDMGLLKLRGNTRLGMLRMTSGQHLPPLLGGALIGAPFGWLSGRLLAGSAPVGSEIPLALLASAAAVLTVLLAGMVVLTIVDAVMLRLPIAVLLQRAAGKRRGRGADVLDLILIALAAAAVYQARTGGQGKGLGLVAPALTALAVALVLARVLGSITERAGGLAIRQGRVRSGLAAVQVSRQTGVDRVFTLVATAVAMIALAAGSLAAATADRATRTTVEVGADRVLTVNADSGTQLLEAVRKADPGGRAAMAVVVDLNTNPPVIAVDSSRLAAVAHWRPEYGPVTALSDALAAARLPAPPPLITGDRLEARLRNDRPRQAILVAVLQHEGTGEPIEATFNPIPIGESTVTARVPACAVAPGCRLVRWQLATLRDTEARPEPGAVTVRGLRQRGPDAEILGPAQLGDVARWYPDYGGAALHLTMTPAGLRMTAAESGAAVAGDRVYVADAPRPLPVVLAGPLPKEWRYSDATSPRFSASATPVRVVAATGLLPVLGRAGLMVDLDSARRTSADAGLTGTSEVWLAADAPPSVLAGLRDAGLDVIAERSVAARGEQLAQQASVAGARFGLLTVVIGLLLAATTVAVTAAADRKPYAAQLRALRLQGLPESTAVGAGRAGIAALVAAGWLAGLLAAVLAVPIDGLTAPPFSDGWRLIAAPSPLGLPALGLAALLAAGVLAVTGVLAARPLVARIRRRRR